MEYTFFTNPDYKKFDRNEGFIVTPLGIMEVGSGYRILYARGSSRSDIVDLFLVKVDKTGKVLEQKMISEYMYSFTELINVDHSYFYFLIDSEDNQNYLQKIDGEGVITSIPIAVSLDFYDFFYKDNIIYGLLGDDSEFFQKLISVDSQGNVLMEIELDHVIEDDAGVDIVVADNSIFLYDSINSFLYIFSLSGNLVDTISLSYPEEYIFELVDVVYMNNSYSLFFKDTDFSGMVAKYDNDFKIQKQYFYEAPSDEDVVVYHDSKLYFYTNVVLQENKYQLISIYKFN